RARARLRAAAAAVDGCRALLHNAADERPLRSNRRVGANPAARAALRRLRVARAGSRRAGRRATSRRAREPPARAALGSVGRGARAPVLPFRARPQRRLAGPLPGSRAVPAPLQLLPRLPAGAYPRAAFARRDAV